ncbi:MAG TPA: hypothetical protein VFD27_05280 [Chthoniobacteraceae bacterium]|jgi:hypothetical protein|nr:hypothetical protein [Chthoniobacteraceae bacterium]
MNTPQPWRPGRQIAASLTSRTANFFRVLAYLFISFSVYLLVHAAYDEDRGIADPPYVPVNGYTFYDRPVEHRDTHPEMFRALMNYEWACPIAVLAAGLIILGVVRRADRRDPFSPSFSGTSALADCERTLDSELRKKHSPLR